MNKFYRFSNKTAKTAELTIFDEIGFFGVTAKDFFDELKGVTASKLVLHINSPGGAVFEGFGIYNALRHHSAKVEVWIDGVAASIASVIAMAGDRVIMPENSMMFVHNPMAMVMMGNADELRKEADDLDKIGEGIISAYVNKTGASREQVKEWMDNETLFTAEEALNFGFADELEEAVKVAACFDIQKHFPQINLNMNDCEEQQNNINQGDNTMDLKEAKEIINMLESDYSALKQKSEADVIALNDAHATKVETAIAETTESVTNAEKKRKDGILALRDKYNDKGDLDSITTDALAGDVAVDKFKDQVMDAINERLTRSAIRPDAGNSTNGELSEKEKKIENLRKRANASTDPVEKGRIGKELAALRKN